MLKYYSVSHADEVRYIVFLDDIKGWFTHCCYCTSYELGKIPGNRLEKLEGDRARQYSIRINDQYRICFVWIAEDPIDVEIVDYHR
ncbi:MAG: hypothetical protein F6K47_10300 [Symploca sp. SIO2E6]|nr:hypothetical protein [Symploca sp. SIO2E6]